MPTIDILGNAYEHKKNARRQLEAQARADIRAKLESINEEFDQMVLRAYSEGAKITRMAKEMQTSATVVYACLDRARQMTGLIPEFDPLAQRYSRTEDGSIMVTLTDEDVAPVMARFKQADVWGDRPTPKTGRFELDPVAGWRWADGQENVLRDPVEPARWIENPVMLWFDEYPANKAELIEWANK